MTQAPLRREVDEAALRKRLFYDGHGTGEDKRFVNIMRGVAKLYLVEQPEEEFQKLHNSVSKEISAVMGVVEKQLKISARCDRTIEYMEQAIVEEERKIEDARGELANLHLELEFVDKLKKISVYPDCTTTEQAIKAVERRKEKLLAQIKKCRQHILTILNSCKELRQVLEEDRGEKEDKDEDTDQIGDSISMDIDSAHMTNTGPHLKAENS